MSVNHFDVTVESCDRRDSHAWVTLGRTKLAARRWVRYERANEPGATHANELLRLLRDDGAR